MLAPNTDPRTVPSVPNLITILRDHTLWPKDFQWAYWSPNHCAMGLMHRLGWMEPVGGLPAACLATRAAMVLGITDQQSEVAFIRSHGLHSPTPEVVAAALEAILENNHAGT